jgi:hypothetical protein
MIRVCLFVIYTLTLLSKKTFAFPNKAGLCEADADKMAKSAMGGKDDKGLGFSLEADASDETAVIVSIKGKDPFKGLLLYVTEDGSKKPVGGWDNLPDTLQVLSSCADGPTLSHKDPSDKSNLQVSWKPPQDGGNKKFVAHGIVVGKAKSSWQIIELGLSGTVNGTNSKAGSNTSATNSTTNTNSTNSTSTNSTLNGTKVGTSAAPTSGGNNT